MFFIFTYQYAVIGGDMRQKVLFHELTKSASCIWYGVEALAGNNGEASSIEQAVSQAENLLLPIPMCKGDMINIQQKDKAISKDILLQYMKEGQRIFAGCIDEAWKRAAEEKGAVCFDYMKEQTIAIYNSIATAEGTIAEIFAKYPKNLHGEKVLVLGFGICAKTLATKLKALDAKVTIGARNDNVLMEAYAYGYQTVKLEMLAEHINTYPIIINTIPAKILTKKVLEAMEKDAVIYEIASFPYGLDEDAAKEKGITYHICPALPAKYAPVSSAEMLKQFIENKNQ